MEGLVMIVVLMVVFWMFVGAADSSEADEKERQMDIEALKRLKKGKVHK
jgi:preprotein translocase subunit YajC